MKLLIFYAYKFLILLKELQYYHNLKHKGVQKLNEEIAFFYVIEALNAR